MKLEKKPAHEGVFKKLPAPPIKSGKDKYPEMQKQGAFWELKSSKSKDK